MSKRSNNAALAVALVLLVLVNVVAGLVHARFDLTQERRYSLSAPTRKLLRNLKEEVTVDVFLGSKDLPAFVRKFRGSVADFLADAREASNNKLKFRFVDPFEGDTAAARPLLDSLRDVYGLTPVAVQAPERVGEKLDVTSVIHGAVVRFGDATVGVDLLKGQRSFGTSSEELAALYNNLEASIEYKFASAIDKVTTKEKPLVAYLLGNGEVFDPRIDDAFRTLRQEYFTDTLNLQSVPFIPEQINAVVIVKPSTAFTNKDKLKLDQYVTHGGKLFWMVDNMYAEADSLFKSNGFIAYDRGLNLEDLFFNWGFRINQDLLQDMQSDQLPQVGSNGQRRFVYWPFFPVLDGTQHPISKNLDGVRALFPTTIDTVEATGIRKTVLLHSSVNARTLPAPAKIDFEFFQIAPDEKQFRKKNVPVAYLGEGVFRSLYADRIPRSVVDTLASMSYDFYPAGRAQNKIIIVADGDLALNQFDQQGAPLEMGTNFYLRYTYANKEFFLNSLEYLVNSSGILQTRSKEYSLRLLDPRKTREEKMRWQLINIVLPILLMIAFGRLYALLRRTRYAK